MGQTLFTAKLLEPFKPRSIESVALCAMDDDLLRSMLEAYPGCKVVVCPPEVCEVSRSPEAGSSPSTVTTSTPSRVTV